MTSIVLVVDDEPEKIGIITNALSGSYNVQGFSNMDSQAVVEEVKRVNPGVVLLDMYDPRLGLVGDKTVTQLRHHYSKAKLPIILYTQQGVSPFEKAIQGIRNGAQDLIWKDDSPAAIRSRIDEVLQAQKGSKIRRSIDVAVASLTPVATTLIVGSIGSIFSEANMLSVLAKGYLYLALAISVVILIAYGYFRHSDT